MRVLVVDDSPIMLERLASLLSTLPDEIELVGQAQDPVGALESVRKMKPDTVILDIHMPGGNGIDVLKEIKKNRPAPIVVMLTNYPYSQYRRRCIDAGAEFFLDKSAEFDRLPGLLRHLLRYPQSRQRATGADSLQAAEAPRLRQLAIVKPWP